VLVTGASGRVGRQAVAWLAEAGYRVLAHDLHPADHPASVTSVLGGLADVDADLLRGVDSVVHLAAVQSWDDARAGDVLDTNVMGTFHLLRAAVAAGVRRIVFASSGEVYPETAPRTMPIDEAHPRLPTNHYGLSKVIGEEMVSYYRRRYGLETVVLRLCHVLDPAEILDPDADGEGPRRFFLHQRLRQEEARGNRQRVALLRSLRDGPHQLIAVRHSGGRPARMGISPRGTSRWLSSWRSRHPRRTVRRPAWVRTSRSTWPTSLTGSAPRPACPSSTSPSPVRTWTTGRSTAGPGKCSASGRGSATTGWWSSPPKRGVPG